MSIIVLFFIMEKFHQEAFESSEDAEFDTWATSAGETELSKCGAGEESAMKRLVMIRRTEQRTFLVNKTGKEPEMETVTRECIETFSGGRRITTGEKRHVQPRPEDTQIFEVALQTQKIQLGIPEPVLPPPAPIEEEKPKETVAEKKEEPKEEKKKESDEQDDLGDFSKFEIECLRRHNVLRAKHGCPPMVLDKTVCKYALNWAKNIAARNVLQHSNCQSAGYGENIAMAYGQQNVDGAYAVNMFYDEIKLHNYSSNAFVYATGHFTQVVWKSSNKLGVGVGTASNGTKYIVCNYSPPGNYQGKFPQNVPRPIA